MVPVKVGEKFDYEAVNIDSDWNDSNDSELIMHTIHSYPAKFPAFIAWKAFEYAQNEGVKIKNVSDIFCGCGTVALEAKICLLYTSSSILNYNMDERVKGWKKRFCQRRVRI